MRPTGISIAESNGSSSKISANEKAQSKGTLFQGSSGKAVDNGNMPRPVSGIITPTPDGSKDGFIFTQPAHFPSR